MSEIVEVDFSPKDGDADDVGLRVKKRDFMACQHASVVVDEALRRVACKSCGEILDPVEVLLYWSRHWERYATSVLGLRQEQDRRSKEIERLKQVEANARARIRRVEASAEPPR